MIDGKEIKIESTDSVIHVDVCWGAKNLSYLFVPDQDPPASHLSNVKIKIVGGGEFRCLNKFLESITGLKDEIYALTIINNSDAGTLYLRWW